MDGLMNMGLANTVPKVAGEVVEGGGDEPVDNNIRKDWNDYVLFLEKQGLKGSPNLDKNDLWGKMIDKYRQVNPKTSISRERVADIQKEFQKYREHSLNQIKSGKAGFAEGTNEENFMKSLSIVDGIAGQRTTSFMFPNEYLKTFEDNSLKSIVNKGFAKTNK